MFGAVLGNCVFALTFLSAISGEDYPPRAQNVMWSSNNFKTILTWSPKPTNYAYSVEYSRPGENKNLHCILTRETECDMTDKLDDLNSTYTVGVISEPQFSANTDFGELPYASAPRFCPYEDTKIGSPEFKVVQNEDKTKMELHIQDPLTAIKRNGRPLNIREIFRGDLIYKVQYSKAGSTGKSKAESHTNVVEIKKLDADTSYCFIVATYIKSRKQANRMGDWSSVPICWPPNKLHFLEEFSWYMLAGGAGILLLILILLIVIIVLCCKRAHLSKQIKLEAAGLSKTTAV